jgi:hypothetical protein
MPTRGNKAKPRIQASVAAGDRRSRMIHTQSATTQIVSPIVNRIMKSLMEPPR